MAQDPQALLRQAEKAASGGKGGFSFFGGKTDKLEQAADLYTQAANAFRLQKDGESAGQAFEKAAAIQKDQLKEGGDAANSYVEASKVYRKTSPESCVRVLSQAIDYYTLSGAFRRAATHKETLGDIYSIDLGDNQHAIEAFETAGQWYEDDNAKSIANKNFLKAADLAALAEDYYKAIGHYEKVAKDSLSNNTMKWSVKDYLFKAGICHLATNDMVGFNRALQGYAQMDPNFTTQREHKLLVDLGEAIEKGDKDAFEGSLFQWNQLSPLDSWKTTMFLRIKNAVENAEEDFA
ncbi:TPR-like protein [Rhizodiscina lignyota]|uniref:TPR-like protein n=1 Tax=Rhizodiscina lignyota TaxID=1504668 RepID=A0A9P4I719_9PEZI|nr:TPR-like protein [Rhizodiscina lignyota]